MIFDGKISAQTPNFKENFLKVLCSKCRKLIPAPRHHFVSVFNKDGKESIYTTFNYIGCKEFIYESKSGVPACYCSKWCRNKHNHRFN